MSADVDEACLEVQFLSCGNPKYCKNESLWVKLIYSRVVEWILVYQSLSEL